MLKLNRLFFALWPDEPVRQACTEAVRALRLKMQPNGKATPPDRYHITLAFLGHTVSPEQEAAAIAAAQRVQVPPFTLVLDSAGSFRNRQILWWLGPREAPPALLALHEALHRALADAGVPAERSRFVPHITVLRDVREPLPRTAVAPVIWTVERFALMRSRLEEQPLRYEPVQSWPLGQAQAPTVQQQLALW